MYNVSTNQIIAGVLYRVIGEASVTYNEATYATGFTFRGIAGVNTFNYLGDGTQALVEVLELKGVAIELKENDADSPVFTDKTVLNGFSIELSLNEEEKIVNDVTQINGFSIEFIDFPFYSFEITEKIG